MRELVLEHRDWIQPAVSATAAPEVDADPDDEHTGAEIEGVTEENETVSSISSQSSTNDSSYFFLKHPVMPFMRHSSYRSFK